MLGDAPAKRALVIALLLAAQAGLFVNRGVYDDRCDVNPGSECFAQDYEQYVGTTQRVGGHVTDDDPLTISDDYAPGETFTVRLQGIDQEIGNGSKVVVYGTLESDRTVQVSDHVVHETTNLGYMYGISAAAIVLVVALGLRDWRFDTDDLVFRNRRDD